MREVLNRSLVRTSSFPCSHCFSFSVRAYSVVQVTTSHQLRSKADLQLLEQGSTPKILAPQSTTSFVPPWYSHQQGALRETSRIRCGRRDRALSIRAGSCSGRGRQALDAHSKVVRSGVSTSRGQSSRAALCISSAPRTFSLPRSLLRRRPLRRTSFRARPAPPPPKLR